MLRLKPAGAAEWHDLGQGVRACVRPGTSIHEQAARSLAAAQIAKALEGIDILADIGVEMGEDQLRTRPGMVLGLSELMTAVELGVLLIEDWEGVGDEYGAAQPPERRWILQLFLLHPAIRTKFWHAAFGHRFQEEAEGNGSALSPTGSPAGARTTASAAANSKAPARKAAGSKRPRVKKGSSAR